MCPIVDQTIMSVQMDQPGHEMGLIPERRLQLWHPDLQQWRPVLNVEDAEIFSVILLLDLLNVDGYIGVK